MGRGSRRAMRRGRGVPCGRLSAVSAWRLAFVRMIADGIAAGVAWPYAFPPIVAKGAALY